MQRILYSLGISCHTHLSFTLDPTAPRRPLGKSGQNGYKGYFIILSGCPVKKLLKLQCPQDHLSQPLRHHGEGSWSLCICLLPFSVCLLLSQASSQSQTCLFLDTCGSSSLYEPGNFLQALQARFPSLSLNQALVWKMGFPLLDSSLFPWIKGCAFLSPHTEEGRHWN